MRDRIRNIPARRWLAAVLIAGSLSVALSGAALAAEEGSAHGSGDLPTGAIVGLGVSIALAGLLLAISAPYILPKPPKRSRRRPC